MRAVAPLMTVAEKIAAGLARAIEVGECLEWQGAYACAGVTPVIKIRRPQSYADNLSVCRAIWEEKHGPIPEGKLIYRTCCNNRCVCEDHLAIGTRKQWLAHRKRNGMTKHHQSTKVRMTVSARNRRTTVNSLERAREVRALVGSYSYERISEQTGVSVAMIGEIARNECWKELSSPFAGLGA